MGIKTPLEPKLLFPVTVMIQFINISANHNKNQIQVHSDQFKIVLFYLLWVGDYTNPA